MISFLFQTPNHYVPQIVMCAQIFKKIFTLGNETDTLFTPFIFVKIFYRSDHTWSCKKQGSQGHSFPTIYPFLGTRIFEETDVTMAITHGNQGLLWVYIHCGDVTFLGLLREPNT